MFINGLVVAVVLLFSFGVDVTNRLVHQRYDQTVSSQRVLIACNNASKVFQQQSDELTLHVNNYVETDSTDALLAYFAIIDNQSREHEIEIAEQYDVDCTTLKQALALSDALAEWEIHAFALMAAARGTIRTAPVQVQEYTLPLKERQLPDDEKKALAEQIVHGQEYYGYKNKIYEKLNDFENSVMERTEERLMVETESISSLLHVQNVFEIVEELVIICLALLLYRQVCRAAKPASKGAAHHCGTGRADTDSQSARAGGFHETHVSARGHARRADAPRRGRFQADQRQLWP